MWRKKAGRFDTTMPHGCTVIRTDGLGKQYRILATGRHDTLRDELVGVFRRRSRPGVEIIWALRDFSLKVRQGEIIGVIGRNGAGKSTLLKILSRITPPTTGSAEIRGRVGSLLEVGTGFHPELTGRENIYLNGAILGMTKREIDRKFDAIIDFAEVGQFIDTPVKRYSSGMSVRLAFAVAAHLQPEILLLDEVLSVGDAAFQRKCLGKMEDVAREGRTIVFVSHNMAAVQNLCTRGVVIREGRMVFDGPAAEAVSTYLQQTAPSDETAFVDRSGRRGDGSIVFTGARVVTDSGDTALIAGRPVTFEFAYENLAGARRAQVIFTLFNHLGVAVANFDTDLTGFIPEPLGVRGCFRCRLPTLPLPLGEHRVAVAAYVGGRLADLISNALKFRVDSSTFFATGRTPDPRYSACMVDHEWDHQDAVSEVFSSVQRE